MELGGFTLIVGAASGIGRETAFTFAERGADGVIFADINQHGATEASEISKIYASKPSYQTFSLQVDVSSRNSVDRMIAEAVSRVGRIDHFINTAGVGLKQDGLITDMPTAEFDRVYNINAKGVFFCTAAIAKVMKAQEERFVEGRNGRRSVGRGSIVTISSLNGVMPIPNQVQYGSSKYAAVGISMTAAVELAGTGVRLNQVLPSWTDTPMIDAEIVRDPNVANMVKTASPLNRMAFPEEIAGAVHFLCSPEASYIHGAQIVIDAAFSLQRGFAEAPKVAEVPRVAPIRETFQQFSSKL